MGLSEAMESNQGSGAREAERAPRIRDLADDVIRCALRAEARGEGPAGELRERLRLLCDRANASGLRPEQLLVILKDGWRESPEARRLTGRRASDVLARVVTLCIHEYYDTERAD